MHPEPQQPHLQKDSIKIKHRYDFRATNVQLLG